MHECNNNFAFPSHSSIYTAILNIHCFFFPLVYICNGCGMPTEDAYSSGHLVLSHFGTCICSNVETNLSRTCLVSGPLNFEHPSVLLFCFLLGCISEDIFNTFQSTNIFRRTRPIIRYRARATLRRPQI